jgi:hypothetical protein
MRNNLVAMLNLVGFDQVLGIESCARLFSADSGLIHFTSALRYPVFLNGKNYSGNPSMIRNKLLRQHIEKYLAEEIRALSADCLYIPLGPKVAEVFEHLSKNGVLSHGRVLSGLPHPSGANNERISYFLGKKDRELLSSKTNPEQIDFARTEIMQKVSAHRA